MEIKVKKKNTHTPNIVHRLCVITYIKRKEKKRRRSEVMKRMNEQTIQNSTYNKLFVSKIS